VRYGNRRRTRSINRSSALLIVDVQIGLVELMSAELQRSVLPKIKTLLTKARASGIPVIFIQHEGDQTGLLYQEE
jgi:nicotinamidase-related amidase